MKQLVLDHEDGLTVPSRGVARRRFRMFQDRIEERAYTEDQKFDQLAKSVFDPSTLAFAFDRLAGKYEDSVAGIDSKTFKQVERTVGRDIFIGELITICRPAKYQPQPLKELMIGNRPCTSDRHGSGGAVRYQIRNRAAS